MGLETQSKVAQGRSSDFKAGLTWVTGFEVDQGNSSRLSTKQQLTLSFTGIDLTQARTSTTVTPSYFIHANFKPFRVVSRHPRSWDYSERKLKLYENFVLHPTFTFFRLTYATSRPRQLSTPFSPSPPVPRLLSAFNIRPFVGTLSICHPHEGFTLTEQCLTACALPPSRARFSCVCWSYGASISCVPS